MLDADIDFQSNGKDTLEEYDKITKKKSLRSSYQEEDQKFKNNYLKEIEIIS
jgi:hypothetical protein